MSPPALITLRGADLGYGRRTVLSGVDLEIRAGDFLGVVGPNGSGKTTLLKAILGTLPPLAGTVVHASPGGGHIRFGYVPQVQTMDRYFPLTAMELVLMGTYGGLRPWGRVGTAERHRARDAMQQARVDQLAERPWQSLSGGQQQRLLIARALASDAQVLALDEPTNGMDLRGEREVMEMVRRLRCERGLTIIMITHLLNLVANHAERLAILDRGRIDVGSRDEILTGPHLERLYDLPVRVVEVEGQRVVVQPGDGDA